MRHERVVVSIALAVLFLGLRSRDADACGGFFCQNIPIDQAGEKILFVVDEEAPRVTVHIQIQYEGEAPYFSWVVPVVALPTFDVGSDEIFVRLLGATTPRFTVESSTRGGCGRCPAGDADVDTDADTDMDTGTATGTGSGVDVVQSGVVGPFEYVTLASDDAEALTRWLVENDYVVPENSEPIIASYVHADYYFVGLKLTKDADVGDLRPIVLQMATDQPCIPLKLTAIAAMPDMPVFAWVLANARTVSTTYLDVVPNDVLVFTGETGYGTAVREAIDAAGGRAFVTEYAGDSSVAEAALDPSGYDTDLFRSLETPWDVMDELRRQGFTGSRLILGILLEHMPPPEGVDPTDFYNWPRRYVGKEYTFDAEALADALEENIVRPLREVHAEFGRYSTLTRLYTVISPNEMTQDPEFVLNRDLPEVGLVRTATVVRDCRDTFSPYDDYGEATTANGHRFCGRDVVASWDWWDEGRPVRIHGYAPGPMSPLERAVQHAAAGPGEVVIDESDAIEAALSCDIPELDDRYETCDDIRSDLDGGAGDDGGDDGRFSARGGAGSLCTATPGRRSAALVLFALVALAVVLARRSVTRRPR